MAIWHLTNAGYFRNNITIRLRERIGSSHHSKRGSEDGGGCPLLHVDDQATNQPGPCLSLLPLLNARLSPHPKQHGAGNPATSSSVVPTNHTHTIRGRAESESSPGRVEWFQADEDTREGGTSHTDGKSPLVTHSHKNITEMQEQDRLFSSFPSSAAFGGQSFLWALDA